MNDINDEVVVTYGDRRDSKFFQYDPKVKLKITGVSDGSISEIVIQAAVIQGLVILCGLMRVIQLVVGTSVVS